MKKIKHTDLMKRRHFLKIVVAHLISYGYLPVAMATTSELRHRIRHENYDVHIKDYLCKMRNFSEHHKGDLYLDHRGFRILKRCLRRLKNLQRIVGHGNFHLLNFYDAQKVARNYSKVGRFPKEELDFLEKIFYEDASRYGFYGKKILKDIDIRIDIHKVIKIPYSGNYLFKGPAFETYQKIKKDLGKRAILTSGIRGVVKQFLLFLDKTYHSRGNLSLASRSLAPPGYSYHSIGDFDIGEVGFGTFNFTERFTTTEVYRRLGDLGYINIRYIKENLFGVRYEPWHIKVI
jgi:hypothetical protein